MESTPNQDVGAGGLTKKQELNNHIVYMRKCVRQAKVHVVRKLVREVKKLRDRKGSPEILLKCNRKADRLHNDILSIKGLNEDKVSVAALLNNSKLEDVLQNNKSTSDERALARLMHHSSVQSKVTEYRNANPHWTLKIPVLLEKTPQKQKKTQKKLEEKERKKKTQTIAKKPVLVNTSEDNIQECNILKTLPKKSLETEDKKTELEANIPLEEVQEPIKRIKKAAEIKPKEPPKIVELNKTVGTIKVQVISDWNEFDAEEGVNKEFSSVQDGVSKKPKSSFFVGGEDEVDDRSVSSRDEEQGSKRVWGERRQEWNNTHPAKFNRKFGDTGNEYKFGTNSKPNQFGQPKVGKQASRQFGKRTDHPGHSSSTGYSKTSANVTHKDSTANTNAGGPAEKLHPSWEAKKRQSLNITAFQGKKIKFD